MTYRNHGKQVQGRASTIFSCDLEEIEDERPKQENGNIYIDSSKLERHQRGTKITVPPKAADHKLIGRVDVSKRRKCKVRKFEDDKQNLQTTEKTSNYPVLGRTQNGFRRCADESATDARMISNFADLVEKTSRDI